MPDQFHNHRLEIDVRGRVVGHCCWGHSSDRPDVSEDGGAVGVITNGSSVEFNNEFHDCKSDIRGVIHGGMCVCHDVFMIKSVPNVGMGPSLIVDSLEVSGKGFMHSLILRAHVLAMFDYARKGAVSEQMVHVLGL